MKLETKDMGQGALYVFSHAYGNIVILLIPINNIHNHTVFHSFDTGFSFIIKFLSPLLFSALGMSETIAICSSGTTQTHFQKFITFCD